ncbi:MAG TPA: hypothetical protein VEA17_14530 [Bordetella sp.]|nr:hypothetical protein [Bordetella sp.]
MGGTAGGGGSGATATANLNAGSVIATSGFGSIGMLMQSIGGGGGNASNAAGGGLFASVTVGGTGGSGGNAGTVQVTATDATVATQGAISPGIVAQSIGGGGGAGGSAFSGSVGAGFSVSAAVGGSGANGGTGGAASVNVIGGSVKTGQSPLMQGTGPGVAGGCTALPCNQLPADNFGVVVQSVGGGGGIAGNATAEAMAIGVPTEDSVSVTATFTLGGSGGSGQDGGTAAFGLSNGGSIETAGQGSTGVVVQSIGGGGGQGGDSTSNSAAVGYGKNAIPGGSGWGMTGTIEVGGSGGSAGNGGNVVLAMGGTASASASSTTADTGSSVGTTSITTYGDHSTAIVAQSIGGGGGNAGWGAGNTQSFGEPTTASLTVGLGARGGLGGVGGTVTANLYSGSIVTWGSSSHGLLAQSVSGGGGTSVGGSFNIVQSFSKANSPITVKPGFNMTLGGEGVPGQDGGQVNATIGASIITKGGNAVGVLAQSIAGGGGVGGSAGADGSADNPIIPSKAIDTTMDALKAREAGSELGALIPDMNNSGSLPSIDPTFGLAIGGTGGQGGDGGQVTVNQNGPITTYGDWSHGILAQSVGGGGGMGGTGAATGTGGIPELTVNVTHAIGGRGGATGSGGPVNIAFGGATPAVTTMGFGAAGVVGQSIGGGGGAGADGSDQATGIISIGAGTASGANGAGGSGQAVSFTTSNSGAAAIATSGDAADGVVLQSIGGGGGLGGAGSSQYQQSWTSASNGSLTLQVGGASSANGTGGNVTFDSTGGPLSISTTGNYAYGILAQSIGGGGGAVSAIATTPNITTQIGGTSSVGGANAGNVNVTLANNSTISTAGYSAFGIMAQSIGGGGGLIRVIGDTSTPPQLDTGSSGSTQQSQPAVGGGGNVSVTVDPTSSVTASGYGAYGIFAQSINGGGGFIANGDVMYAGAPQQDFCADQPGGECAESAESSTVSVDVQGTVSALGSNAGAIFAQAAGYASGDAKISVSGTVQGNTTTNEAGNNTTQTALIQMDTPDGSNLLTVTPGGHVTASSIDGVFGNAVQSLSGMGTVELEGVLTGSLLLRDGKFNVHPGGVHNSGSTTQAGQVVNAGTINVGVPLSSVSSTLVDTVTGDYTQTSQGVLGVTVDSLRTAAGRMNVNGTANMDGVISPSAISLLPGEFTVLTAGTLQGSADAVDSLVIDWGARRSGNQISLTPNANYKPAGVKLTDSQTSLANYMNREWSSANPGAAYRNAGFSRITDAKSYTKALNSVSAKATQAQSIALANSSWTILGSSMSCPVFVASNTLMGEGNCVWGKIDGRWSDQSASGDTQAYDVSSTTYRFGGQHQIAPEWYLGGSLAVGQTWAHMNGGSSGDGDVYDGSITLKHIVGPWQFAGSVAVANGNFDVSRHVDVAGDVATLRGDPSVTMVGARIRVGYEFAHEDWYVKPYGDVDLVYTNMPGFNESGDSNYALNVRGSQQTNVAFTPMLEFGRRMNLDPKTTLRAYAAFGASIRPSAGYTVRSSFTNGLSSDGTFTDHVSAPDVLGKVDMGLQIYRANGFEVKAGYTVDFGSHYVSQTASARFAYHF